nr:transposase [Streptomyces sp. ME19-01-6]
MRGRSGCDRPSAQAAGAGSPRGSRCPAAAGGGSRWPGCCATGLPARLCYRLRRHTGRKGERRSLDESDYIRLLDGAHQLLKAPLIVVWDRLNTHISKTMKALVAEREWLTIVLLPGYAPELNPVEALWAHIKRSLANVAARTLTELETLLRRRLEALQYRHGVLGGFLAGTGLDLDRPDGP